VTNEEIKARAESIFKTKEQQARRAMTDYEARSQQIAEKTERLRALRLAKADADRKPE
jgi:hypothetical protein